MADDSYKGTGDELGRVEVGELEIIFEDDGDPDTHTYVSVKGPRGTVKFGRTGFPARQGEGDDWVVEQLENDPGESGSSVGASSFDRPGPFICDDCGRTWPHANNQTPDGNKDTCPDCAG